MELRLIVNGGDQRIRITPKGGADKKLLEYVAEWDKADLVVSRNSYGRDIEKIDLVLEMAPSKDDSIGVPEIPVTG